MPGLNDAALTIASNALREVLLFAQLHIEPAGIYGTAAVSTAPREAAVWSSITGPGNFHLASALNFTGGEPDRPIYSVSLWDSPDYGAGTFYGEFPITEGERTFSSSGEFTVATLQIDGSSS